MMYRVRALLCILFAMPLCALGQGYVYQTGSPTFSTQIPVEHGFINVNNGELHLDIPVASLLQHGGVLAANAHLVYDSRIWKIVEDAGGNYSWQPTNVPNSLGGWTILTGGETGSSITSIPTGRSNTYEGGTDNFGHLQYCYHLIQSYNKFTWTDPVGTSHVFNGGWTQENYPCNYPSGTPIEDTQETGGGYATDGSGLTLSMSGYRGSSPDQLAYTVKDRSGTQLYPSIVDRNGNGITSSATQTQTGNQIDIAVPTASSAGTVHYIITTEQINFRTLFLQDGVGETSGSLTVVQSIQLPDGSQYRFSYASAKEPFPGTGELTSITLPTGGVINYGYTKFVDSFQNANLWINSHTANGGTTTFTPKTISACSSSQGCQEQVTVNTPDPKSSTGNDAVYTFTLDAGQIANGGSFATNIAAYQGAAGTGKPLRTESNNYTYKTIQDTALYTAEQVQVITATDTLPDAGVATQTQSVYDIYTDLLTDTKAWNYQAGSFAAQPDQDTAYTYQNEGGIPSGLLTNTLVKDGAGSQLSNVKYDYDTKGNPTGQHQWINTTGTTLDTTVNYKSTGALLSSTAPEGKTTYAYDPTDTYVTGVTAPTPSSGAVLTAGTGYNAATGVVTSTTDPNGQVTTYSNFDAFNRVGQIKQPDGGTTAVSYPDAVTVNESTAFESIGPGTIMKQNDTYGRPSRTAVATTLQANTFYQQDTCYDVAGRVQFQSYRYQGPGFSAAKVCSGAGGDTYSYDALGRPTQVRHGDGTSYSYSYTGRAVKTTDENGVMRISQADAFGRITAACELTSAPTGASETPSACGTDISGTGFLTSYSYNPAAFQTTVSQGAQTRVFTTDSLGRQVSAREPESGTTAYSYAYNSTGLLVTRTKPQANQTDPAVTTATVTQYDALDRPISVTYSDGTAPKTYSYDVAATGTNSVNVLGRLALQTAATGAGPAIKAFSYDPLGRTAQVVACTPATCGKSADVQSYVYDFAGNMTGSTDGAGASLVYGYTPANENAGVAAEAGAFPASLINSVVNGPNGPTSYRLGNGLNQVYRYDSLGRRDGGWVCSGSTGAFCAGGTQLYGYSVKYTGSRVNQACDTVLNNCSTATYDDLSRLQARTTTSGTNLDGHWSYDRYGNRLTQTVSPSGYQQQLSVDAGTNRVVGFLYDVAGNLLNDGVHDYSYDAEGNMVAVDGGSQARCFFDAANRRVHLEAFSTVYELLYSLGVEDDVANRKE